MYFAIWALIVGALLITMALSGTWLRRLPVSTAMLYLAAGFSLGPAGLALMAPDPLTYSGILERAAEVAVLISLFDLIIEPVAVPEPPMAALFALGLCALAVARRRRT